MPIVTKGYFEGIKCSICGSRETYIYQGTPKWYYHDDKKICYECHKIINRTPKVKGLRHKGRMCCKCHSKETYIYKGIHRWYRHVLKCDNDNCTGWLCKKCYNREYQSLPDSQNNIIRYIRDSRTGNLDRFSSHGKGIIGQWIGAKTLGLKDLNIENNNFAEPIDLSSHPIYEKPDIKIKTFDNINKWWNITIKKNLNPYYFDTLVVLCADEYEPWKDINRTYIIPKIRIIHVTGITIYNDVSKSNIYEKYRVDERSYNDTYHSIDIPRFFDPFDLWKGRYNK